MNIPEKYTQILQQFRKNWTFPEVLFTAVSIGIVTAATLYQNSSDLTGLICAVTGICYTLLAGKGKIACYFFGIVNSFLYGWISMDCKIYGDMLLNWLYYLPMQFAGIFFWLKHINRHTGEIFRRKLSPAQLGLTILLTGIVWLVFAVILHYLGGAAPFRDSATTVISITGMVLSVMRCFEQWIAWTLVNSISIWIWWEIFQKSGNSIAALLMWCVFLICGLIFAYQWRRDAVNAEEEA